MTLHYTLQQPFAIMIYLSKGASQEIYSEGVQFLKLAHNDIWMIRIHVRLGL